MPTNKKLGHGLYNWTLKDELDHIKGLGKQDYSHSPRVVLLRGYIESLKYERRWDNGDLKELRDLASKELTNEINNA